MNKEYTLTLVTPPKIEPLTLGEVKSYLKVDYEEDTEEDAYIQSLITVAREWCETYQRRSYITQTWELSLQQFPIEHTDTLSDYSQSKIIEIPKGTLQSINSFTYKDLYGNEKTLVENVDYIVGKRGILGKVCPPYAKIFPVTPLWPLDPIVINFTCGYGDDGSKVPTKVKQAMKLLISHWYENRAVVAELRGADPTKEMAFAVTALLTTDRIFSL
jgi:uncharacterized phiE125 gp8 family phage protein